MNVRAALTAAAEIGPFFRVRIVPPDDLGPTAPLARLYTGGPALDARVRATAEALGVSDHRVAGSIFFQGLAARLWSPTLAVAARERRALLLPPDSTVPDDPGLACARPGFTAGSPGPHGSPGPYDSTVSADSPDSPGSCGGDPAGGVGGGGGRPARTDPSLVAHLHEAVIDTHLEPLATGLDVPATTLWGNAASAAVGSYQVMVATRPELADPGLLTSLLRTGRLAHTGRLDTTVRFHRNSCCLYYRVPPGGGLCGDCVLHRRDRSSPETNR